MPIRIRHHNDEQTVPEATVVPRFETGEIPRRAEYLDERRNDWFPVLYLVEELRKKQAEPAPGARRTHAAAPAPARGAGPRSPAGQDLVVGAARRHGRLGGREAVPVEAYRQYLRNHTRHPFARSLLKAATGAGAFAFAPLAVLLLRSSIGLWALPLLVAIVVALGCAYLIGQSLLDAADAAIDSGARSWSERSAASDEGEGPFAPAGRHPEAGS
jgi:hypothetical protein